MANREATVAVEGVADALDAILYNGESHDYQPSTAGPQRYLFITEPPIIELWHPGDDITLACLTNNRTQTFWSFVAEKADDEDLANRAKRWANNPRAMQAFDNYSFSTLPGGGNIYLRYCPLPTHFDLSLVTEYGIPDAEAARLSRTDESVQQAIKSALTVQTQIRATQSQFVQAYALLRTWTENAGLFSRQFGLIDETKLPQMLLQAIPEDFTADEAIQAFLQQYSQTVQATASTGASPSDISTEAAKALADPTLLSAPTETHFQNFLSTHSLFIHIELECWSPKHEADFHTEAIRQITTLVATLRQSLLSTAFRLWPVPVHHSSSDTFPADASTYLIGTGRAQTTSQQLAGMLRDHVFELDPAVGRAVLRLLARDAVSDFTPSHQQGAAKQQSIAQSSAVNVDLEELSTKKKFRTAAQTLSRLRWDPAHSAHDYQVGYLDRFDGLKWMRIEDWGKQTEEEDFIPEHRVQRFRRMDDKVVVWDREKRVDLTGSM